MFDLNFDELLAYVADMGHSSLSHLPEDLRRQLIIRFMSEQVNNIFEELTENNICRIQKIFIKIIETSIDDEETYDNYYYRPLGLAALAIFDQLYQERVDTLLFEEFIKQRTIKEKNIEEEVILDLKRRAKGLS